MLAYCRRRRRFIVQCATNYLMHFLPRWWCLSAKRFVEHCAETVDIGAMIYRRVEIDLFRRHIVRRTEHRAGIGHVAAIGAGELGHPEVDDLHEIARHVAIPDEEYVRRLQIAMDDTASMRSVEPVM